MKSNGKGFNALSSFKLNHEHDESHDHKHKKCENEDHYINKFTV